MHPDVEQLKRLVPAPQQPVAVDLGAFERALGAPLPADYAALMRSYGPGSFDEFLSVFAPDPAKRYDMFENTKDHREINEDLAQLKEGSTSRIRSIPTTRGCCCGASSAAVPAVVAHAGGSRQLAGPHPRDGG